MPPDWSRRTLLATVGTASVAGCFGNEGETQSDTSSPNESEAQSDISSPERVVEEWWNTIWERDIERFRELYHANSPEREESYWDNEDWAESFPPEVLEQATVEDRDLLEETDDEAVVLDVLAEPDENKVRQSSRFAPHRSQPSGFVHQLRSEDDEWRLWTHESEEYICPDNEPGERQADDLPDRCPVSTLDDYEPPENLSCESIVEFVTEYHESYVLNEMYSPTHERDSVAGRVTSIDRHEYGYVVIVGWSGANYSDVIDLEAEPATDPPKSDPPSVETLDSKILREYAIDAAEQDESVADSQRPHWDLDLMRQEVESLQGTDDADAIRVGYVSVDGTTVHLRLTTHTMHGDYFHMSTRYYVDSHVVRQSDEHMGGDEDTDPRRLPLLECQP